MASLVYNKAKEEILSGVIDLTNDAIKVMLVTSVYTPNADDLVVDAGTGSDAQSAEISVTNYTAGFGSASRKALSNKAFATDTTNDRATFDADDLTWTALGAGATIVGAILIKEGTSDTNSRLIAYMDFTDTPTNGGDFTIQWDSTGILRLS